jgi:NADP-dependent 3-hydroxy acid dehydrogenase YdfG
MHKETPASPGKNGDGPNHKLTAGHARQLRYDPRAKKSKAGHCSRPRTVLFNALSANTEGVSAACLAMLAEAGHRVLTIMVDKSMPSALANAIASGQLVALPGPAADAASIQSAIKSLPLSFHTVAAVVNVRQLPACPKGLLDADRPDIESDPSTGAGHLLKAIRAALPGLLASGRGHVIDVTLSAGPDDGIACHGQADALGAALRAELDDLGIRYTRIVAGPMEGQAGADFHGNRPRANGMPRGLLSPADLAEAVAWTLSQPDHLAVRTIDIGLAPRSQPILSPRERQVLEWTACGKTSDEISSILGLSVSAVNFHIRNLLCKLQCCNKTAAVARAALLGLLI